MDPLEISTKKLITQLIKSQDYYAEADTLINAIFLQYAKDLFRRIAFAKLNGKEFPNLSISSDEPKIKADLNRETKKDSCYSTTIEINIEKLSEYYDGIFRLINDLNQSHKEMDITVTLKYGDIRVYMNVSEGLMAINTLAVKRSQLRGGLWSTAGKRVEKPLILTLCNLFGVTDKYYRLKASDKETDEETDFEREIDFFFYNSIKNQEYKCEVKLMGKGNPESADAVIARASKVFVADKLSDLNKRQLESLDVQWVEMRSEGGFRRFVLALSNLGIPYTDFKGDIDSSLERAFDHIFKV